MPCRGNVIKLRLIEQVIVNISLMFLPRSGKGSVEFILSEAVLPCKGNAWNYSSGLINISDHTRFQMCQEIPGIPAKMFSFYDAFPGFPHNRLQF